MSDTSDWQAQLRAVELPPADAVEDAITQLVAAMIDQETKPELLQYRRTVLRYSLASLMQAAGPGDDYE